MILAGRPIWTAAAAAAIWGALRGAAGGWRWLWAVICCRVWRFRWWRHKRRIRLWAAAAKAGGVLGNRSLWLCRTISGPGSLRGATKCRCRCRWWLRAAIRCRGWRFRRRRHKRRLRRVLRGSNDGGIWGIRRFKTRGGTAADVAFWGFGWAAGGLVQHWGGDWRWSVRGRGRRSRRGRGSLRGPSPKT